MNDQSDMLRPSGQAAADSAPVGADDGTEAHHDVETPDSREPDATADPGAADDAVAADDTLADAVGPDGAATDAADQLSTGDAQVDAALSRLGELDERPLDEHVDVYADIHRSLGEVLDGTAGQTDSA